MWLTQKLRQLYIEMLVYASRGKSNMLRHTHSIFLALMLSLLPSSVSKCCICEMLVFVTSMHHLFQTEHTEFSVKRVWRVLADHVRRTRRWGWQSTLDRHECWRSRRSCIVWGTAAQVDVADSDATWGCPDDSRHTARLCSHSDCQNATCAYVYYCTQKHAPHRRQLR